MTPRTPRPPLRQRLILFALSLFLMPDTGHAQDAVNPSAPLPPPFLAAMSRLGVGETDLSVVVLDGEGNTRISHLPNALRHPASTIKLVTTFAALEHFGPVHTFDTEILASAPPSAEGVLAGDLILRPSGDPLMTEERLWKMTRAVVDSGIREIRGDLVIDTRHYEVPETDPGAFDGQPYRLYNVQPYPLLANFKANIFEFRPRGQRVEIRATPALANLEIDNRLTVKQGPCNEYQAGIRMTRLTDTRVRFDGQMPGSCRNYTLSRTFMPHKDYLYGLFKALYAVNGGTLVGKVREGATPANARRVVVWPSASLAEVLVSINKYSNNPMTRMLMLNLGADMFGPPGTPEKGARAVTGSFQRHGIDMSDTRIDNGSGLSRSTRIRARAMAEVLWYASRSPLAPEFLSSMPLSGLDGTLTRRMKTANTRGRAHLKTGRLDGVTALAGYVHTKTGETYTIVLFLNHPDAHLGIGNDLGDLLVAWILGSG